jgi:hypothetical protein
VAHLQLKYPDELMLPNAGIDASTRSVAGAVSAALLNRPRCA